MMDNATISYYLYAFNLANIYKLYINNNINVVDNRSISCRIFISKKIYLYRLLYRYIDSMEYQCIYIISIYLYNKPYYINKYSIITDNILKR